VIIQMLNFQGQHMESVDMPVVPRVGEKIGINKVLYEVRQVCYNCDVGTFWDTVKIVLIIKKVEFE
jgi:hypothetical protein